MRSRIVRIAAALLLLVYTTAAAGGAEDAAQPPSAQITVLTGGEPCRIFIDGVFVGEGAVMVPVSPGKRKVRAVPATGKAKEKTVKVGPNETQVVRFEFPLPKAVQDALSGGGKTQDDDDWSSLRLGCCIAGLAIIGGGIALAVGSGSSHYEPQLSVSQRDITLSVRSNLGTPDGDRIHLFVNGVKLLDNYELTGSDMTVSVSLAGGLNVLAIQAVNEGTTPPNTGTITVSHVTDGSGTLTWSLVTGGTGFIEIGAP